MFKPVQERDHATFFKVLCMKTNQYKFKMFQTATIMKVGFHLSFQLESNNYNELDSVYLEEKLIAIDPQPEFHKYFIFINYK